MPQSESNVIQRRPELPIYNECTKIRSDYRLCYFLPYMKYINCSI